MNTAAKIVLVSTYELGRQPFGLASPAAWLRKHGHSVVCFDLARQELEESVVKSADLIAIYLPMHTATRLAAQLLPALRAQNPCAHLCCYGLYAPMNEAYLRSLGVSTILGGEFENGLVHLADRVLQTSGSGASQLPQQESVVSMERLQFEVPDRSGMPALQKYAHLIIPANGPQDETGKGYRIVGSTEASRGCKHLCRHCPIVPVYNGVFRIVPGEIVLEDVRRQVAEGAQHISFGDPDFFNGIGHAIPLVEQFHRELPEITYDVTIKIEHLRKYAEQIPKLKETGCLFVISAVESVDDAVLAALEKGHARADFLQVAEAFRALGMTLHPTFVPFSPWTTMDSYLDLLKVIYEQQLTENVAPIQLGIRLLIPEGSRMLELKDIRQAIGPFDRESLVYPWKHADPRVDALSDTVQQIAAAADREKATRTQAFERVWIAAHRVAGMAAPPLAKNNAARAVPFLSEPWYCCAEPTRDQLISIGRPRSAPSVATVSADSVV